MDILKLCNEALILSERNNDLELFDLINQIKTEALALQTKGNNQTVSPLTIEEEQWGHFISNND